MGTRGRGLSSSGISVLSPEVFRRRCKRVKSRKLLTTKHEVSPGPFLFDGNLVNSLTPLLSLVGLLSDCL